jgi:calcineurin-like phosphoesterase family protein
MKVWITADTHFGSPEILNVASRSQFSTIEEHDDHLLSYINNLVHRNDRLIVAGDFGKEQYRHRITCKDVVLIRGNHDKKNPKLFTRVLDGLSVRCPDGFKIWVSHYPHAYWDGSHNGHGHVYGHVHSLREQTLDNRFPERRSIDIGVDNAKRLLGEYRPFSLEEIHERLIRRIGHDQLSFYRVLDEQKAKAK